jgi:hypothetical protein
MWLGKLMNVSVMARLQAPRFHMRRRGSIAAAEHSRLNCHVSASTPLTYMKRRWENICNLEQDLKIEHVLALRH